MAEYIEREATCKDCIHYDICIFHHEGNENKKCVHFKNKADVVEVRHGHWKMRGGWFRCSICDGRALLQDVGGTGGFSHEYEQVKSEHCPHCFAKMDGKGE